MAELIAPTERLYAAWLQGHAEWGAGLHENGFGLLATDEVGSLPGFRIWVARLADESGGTCWWIVEDDQVLGGIALRHQNHELAARAGHIG
ncbi:hypothetical protein M1D88_18800 [Arthrobacter sp. R1-13]